MECDDETLKIAIASGMNVQSESNYRDPISFVINSFPSKHFTEMSLPCAGTVSSLLRSALACERWLNMRLIGRTIRMAQH